MAGPMYIDQEENLSPSEKAAEIALRQNSGEDAKNLIFSPFKCEDRQVELSRAAQVRKQRMASERQAKNHLIRNRQALKEKQQHNKKSIQEKQARESLLLQQRERKKQELYGGVKSRVFDQDYAASKTVESSTDDCNFSLSSLTKSYGKVPKYIANRKSMLEREERWG
eukprot:scaffold33588_cov128-Skeletonema_dohrnii-CCMP3373.AAC.3